ncbi:TPA: hypothetical protein ACQZB2_004504 [Escherichia coli]
MSHSLEHQKVHTRMVKVLKAVARANNYPYQSVFANFMSGPSCTVCFQTFHKTFPDSPYECVTFCH